MFIDSPRQSLHQGKNAQSCHTRRPPACFVGLHRRYDRRDAVDVVSLPVKAAAAGVDAVTTSQAEADEKRGRELRKAEEEAGREAREAEKKCREAAARGSPCPPPHAG